MMEFLLEKLFPDSKNLPIWAEAAEFALILLIGWLMWKVIRVMVRKVLAKSTLDDAVHILIIRVVSIVWWILILLVIISKLDFINMAPILTVLGTGGAVAAIAMKDGLSNVAGGFTMLFSKPFTAGDEIEIGDTAGIVDHIDLLTTQLHTYDNKVVIIPNGTVTTSVIINTTKRDIRRVNVEFSIADERQSERAKDIIYQAVKGGKLFLKDPSPKVLFKRDDAYTAVLNAGAWCRTEDRFAAVEYLREEVKKAFEAENIETGYRRTDVSTLR